MSCIYTYKGKTFKSESELNDFLLANGFNTTIHKSKIEIV